MLCRHYIRRPLTPAVAASGALGLKLLMTVAPASAQDADRSIPCASGMAGVYACDRVDLLSRLSREQLGAADTVKLNDVWGWRGDRLYLALKRSGLRVLDIADRTNPVEVGYFDTTPADPSGADTIPAGASTLARAASFHGAWSVYPFFESGSVLVSSRSEGLFVVRPSEDR